MLLDIANNPCAPPCTGPTPFIQNAMEKLPGDFNASGIFLTTIEPPAPTCAAEPSVTPGTNEILVAVVGNLNSPVSLVSPLKCQ